MCLWYNNAPNGLFPREETLSRPMSNRQHTARRRGGVAPFKHYIHSLLCFILKDTMFVPRCACSLYRNQLSTLVWFLLVWHLLSAKQFRLQKCYSKIRLHQYCGYLSFISSLLSQTQQVLRSHGILRDPAVLELYSLGLLRAEEGSRIFTRRMKSPNWELWCRSLVTITILFCTVSVQFKPK